MPVDLFERWVSSVDQVAQVVNRWRFVLDQDEQEVQGQSRQCLTVTRLIDGTDVRYSLRKSKITND